MRWHGSNLTWWAPGRGHESGARQACPDSCAFACLALKLTMYVLLLTWTQAKRGAGGLIKGGLFILMGSLDPLKLDMKPLAVIVYKKPYVSNMQLWLSNSELGSELALRSAPPCKCKKRQAGTMKTKSTQSQHICPAEPRRAHREQGAQPGVSLLWFHLHPRSHLHPRRQPGIKTIKVGFRWWER